MRKFAAFFLVLLCASAFLAGSLPLAEAQITIYSNGPVSGTDKIRRDGNVYTLTGDIIYTIRVGRSDIVIDGAGYTLERNEIQRNRAGVIILPGVNKVTIRNLKVTGFSNGITLKGKGNLVTRCTITDCFTGIWLNEAKGNTVSDNEFFNNNMGIQLSSSSSNQFRNNRFRNCGFCRMCTLDRFHTFFKRSFGNRCQYFCSLR